MAIHNFANFDQYEINNIKSLMNSVNAITPVFKGVSFRWGYHLTSFNVYVEKPTINVDPLQRTWLRIQPISGLTTSARTGAIYITNADIDPPLRTPGTVVMFSFRFGSCQGNNASAAFLGYRAPSTSAVTTLTSITDDRAKIGPNEYRWVDFRITYGANESCTVDVFCNKEKVHTFTAAGGLIWGVGAGNLSNSLSTSYSANFGFWLNDFLTVIDKEGETPTGMMGPVTAVSLPLEEPVVEGEWICSNPNKSIKDILATPLKDQSSTMTGEYIATDPADRPAHFRFTPPLNEKLKIVGFQQGFIAQQPLAFSTSLQYMQTLDGESIDPSGWKTTINVALEPGYSHIRTPAISQQPDGKDLTPEFIGRLGLSLNSTKKLIEDDPPIEEEAPPEEEV